MGKNISVGKPRPLNSRNSDLWINRKQLLPNKSVNNGCSSDYKQVASDSVCFIKKDKKLACSATYVRVFVVKLVFFLCVCLSLPLKPPTLWHRNDVLRWDGTLNTLGPFILCLTSGYIHSKPSVNPWYNVDDHSFSCNWEAWVAQCNESLLWSRVSMAFW